MGKVLAVMVGVLVLVVIALAVIGVGGYNKLVDGQERVDSAWSQVENVYQRRADLVPNLVKTVKGAADFEQETLQQITDARSRVGEINFDGAPDADQLAEFQQAQEGLRSALSRLLVVVERYPELRATEAFRDLQSQLEGAENRITVERGRFNEATETYNATRRRFPTNLLANTFGFSPRPYFEADEDASEVPVVDFGDG